MASFWSLLQNWAAVARIGFFSYLTLLLIPSLLFVASDLLFPERGAESAIGLKAHFFRIKRRTGLRRLSTGAAVEAPPNKVGSAFACVIIRELRRGRLRVQAVRELGKAGEDSVCTSGQPKVHTDPSLLLNHERPHDRQRQTCDPARDRDQFPSLADRCGIARRVVN
jgi:hypothetical protein